jgi:Tol biopolymer transport system component
MVVTLGCGDSKPPVVTYVARSNSEGVPPQVYTLNEATGQSTALSIAIPADAFSVSTNRDASKVLYVRDGDSGWDVFLMGADGVEHQLTTGDDAWGPVFSPDGKKIAFMSYQSVNYQIYTMNADGSGSTPLFVNTDIEQDFPVFTADGKSLVFNVWIGCNCAAAQRHAPAGRGLHQPPHALKAQNHSATKANAAAITQNGFYKMALSDSAPTLTYATDEWWGPTALTQNGKGIIFTMYDGTEDNIFKVNLDGSALTPLTTDTTTYDFAPISYKNLILFNRYNSDNSSGDIYVMDQDGANQKLVHSTDSTYEMLVDAYWD